MNRKEILEYYSRDEIVKEISRIAANREVGGAFPTGGYDSRPNMIQYPSDVVQMAKRGVSSFHFSVEKWKYPMQLNSSLTREQLDENRMGWDLVIDIDSKIGMDGSKMAAILVCDFLEKYGIKNYSIKFSGSRGFHIAVPASAWPVNVDYKPMSSLYPKIPRLVSSFIRGKIRERLMEEILKLKTMKELTDILGEAPSKMDPYLFVDIEKNWGSRHLFRAPYSFNEKTWLVSVPLKYNHIKDFSFDMAKPETVKAREFIKDASGEAINLLTDVMDWYAARKKYIEQKAKKVEIKPYERKVPEELFPPCIKNILAGLRDGKKRSIFTLINFLKMAGWNNEDVEKRLYQWNSQNSPPLPRNALLGQIRWNNMQRKKINPANCFNDMFYVGIGVCKPDNNCKRIKNPISYPFTKMEKKVDEKNFRGFSCGVCNEEFPMFKKLKRRL